MPSLDFIHLSNLDYKDIRDRQNANKAANQQEKSVNQARQQLMKRVKLNRR